MPHVVGGAEQPIMVGRIRPCEPLPATCELAAILSCIRLLNLPSSAMHDPRIDNLPICSRP